MCGCTERKVDSIRWTATITFSFVCTFFRPFGHKAYKYNDCGHHQPNFSGKKNTISGSRIQLQLFVIMFGSEYCYGCDIVLTQCWSLIHAIEEPTEEPILHDRPFGCWPNSNNIFGFPNGRSAPSAFSQPNYIFNIQFLSFALSHACNGAHFFLLFVPLLPFYHFLETPHYFSSTRFFQFGFFLFHSLPKPKK